MTASTICLLHCLLTPVTISLFPSILQLLPGNVSFHRLLTVAIVLFGLTSFLPGYKLHRRKPLLALIALGMSLILAIAWAGESLSPAFELLLSVTGSLLLVTAHLLNRSFCRQCRVCTDAVAACHTTHVK